MTGHVQQLHHRKRTKERVDSVTIKGKCTGLY